MGRKGGHGKKEHKEEKGAGHAAERDEILCFYGHAPDKEYRQFSNFYVHEVPFEFVLPDFARRGSHDSFPPSLRCEFSEKAIMATKAALMNDPETFKEIEQCKDPFECKDLGRRVLHWDQELWDKHLKTIAFEVVRQKFESDEGLKKVLLSTGDRTIAEAAPGDRIWGIGLGCSHADAKDRKKWRGTNILGFALMEARDHILKADCVGHASAGAAASTADVAEASAEGLSKAASSSSSGATEAGQISTGGESVQDE